MKFEDDIRQKKGREKIVMLTAYDYQVAKILDDGPIDMILVGDSLGMVFQGQNSTKQVTMENMLYHTKAVVRGACHIPIIADMPAGSCRTPESAKENAKRFLEVGAHGVKVEGNKPETIKGLAESGIPSMGHVGLLPQTARVYKVQGKDPKEAERLLQDALEIDRSGVFTMVLECVPEKLAKRITESVNVPTIGIGAGKFCDGQVLVINDMLGLGDGFTPKFLKKYANLNKTIKEALEEFSHEVRIGVYPDSEHTYH